MMSTVTAMAKITEEIPGVGAHVQHNYARRTVTVYGVMEHEMDNLTTWNTFGSLSYSASAASFSFAMTLFIENQVNPDKTPAAEALITAGIPLGLIASLVACGLGCWLTWKRGGTLKRIKRESEAVDDPVKGA